MACAAMASLRVLAAYSRVCGINELLGVLLMFWPGVAWRVLLICPMAGTLLFRGQVGVRPIAGSNELSSELQVFAVS